MSAFAQESHLPPIVRQVDHIIIRSDMPEQLFRFFSEKLGLPVVWPFQSYGTFSSGGITFGNVNIEASHLQGPRSGLAGVAMEPSSVSEAVTGLDARGLKHGSPKPFSQKDSSGNEIGWTTIGITSLPPAPAVFFCKYTFDTDARRATGRRELQTKNGGPLGIESAVELVIGVRDITAAQRGWSALLGSAQMGKESTWQVGSGPAIRLIAGQEDHFAQLRIKVKSLERARAFLRSENLLGDDTGDEISLERSRVAGADLRLVQ